MHVNSPFLILAYCMVWKYTLNKDGYGILTIDGKQELAPRVVFIQTRGTVPGGMQVNHLCNRPYCVQPAHLYAGSAQDNSDDSRIFNEHELMNAPWVLSWPEEVDTMEPLLRRLRESGRHHGTEPWEPREQPPQLPLEEFSCPGHDFAITMQGGNSKICRICETSESNDRMADEHDLWMLIGEICPASQTVAQIWQKITKSDFVGESYLEIRRSAHRRHNQALWKGSHYVRNCGCGYCTQDRMTFRKALDPLLTTGESAILDICDHLEPRIADTLYEASATMMEVLAKEMGMDENQTSALREHIWECPNSTSMLTGESRTIESDFAYLLYALGKFKNREEMLDEQGFQQVMMRWSMVRVKPEDKEHLIGTVLPIPDETAEKMELAWKREAETLLRPYLETSLGLYEDLGFLARMVARKHTFEHLRYEFLGRNSYTDQRPHPHSGCVVSIRETGRVEPFPNDFEEGKGYMPPER